jgi:thioredoxin-like negative regulator of GroEL
MSSIAQAAPVGARVHDGTKPRLVFFFSPTSGRCRRVEAYVAQVLQRRRNHETFALHKVDADNRPDLAERFPISSLPALVVVIGRQVRGRLDSPKGCRDIEDFLAPWLH